jgi:ADP-ribose pyrophosphatase
LHARYVQHGVKMISQLSYSYMWQTLSSKEIFSHPRLTLIEDEVLLPNGSKTSYLTYKDTGNVATLICKNAEGKILLQREYSYPSRRVLYQFPGGFVPANEDITVGANRELMEEVKLRANTLMLLGAFLLNDRRSTSRDYVFLAMDFQEDALKEDIEEEIENIWFEESEIERMIVSGEIIALDILAAWTLYQLKK